LALLSKNLKKNKRGKGEGSGDTRKVKKATERPFLPFDPPDVVTAATTSAAPGPIRRENPLGTASVPFLPFEPPISSSVIIPMSSDEDGPNAQLSDYELARNANVCKNNHLPVVASASTSDRGARAKTVTVAASVSTSG